MRINTISKNDYNKAKKMFGVNPNLAVSTLQVKLGLGFDKANNLLDKFRQEAGIIKPVRMSPLQFENAFLFTKRAKADVYLVESLINLFDDDIGREALKICMNYHSSKKISLEKLFDKIRGDYNISYRRTATYINISKELYDFLNPKVKKIR